ncbi:hypothetical protein Aduo_000929 [Ancylostoma duodenale]
MMNQNLFAGGYIESDYVMDQLNEQEQAKVSETMPTSLTGEKRSTIRYQIPSHYVDKDLHSFIVVGENRNHQEFPSTARGTPLVGNPVSADELRRRVDALDNSVYSPIIVNGKLYFINLDNDTRTARSSTDVDNNIRTEILMKS